MCVGDDRGPSLWPISRFVDRGYDDSAYERTELRPADLVNVEADDVSHPQALSAPSILWELAAFVSFHDLLACAN